MLGFFLKPLRKFFPPVVTGTVVLSIGLSLISVGINSFGGGNSAKDFGSMENLLLALFVLVVILIFKHWTTGFLSSSAILIGILAGYIAAFVMGLVLPTTGVTADGVEFTKAWVLNWNKVAQASWFAIPKLMPVKIVFDMRAIMPVMIMFVVTAVETVGDISGVMEGGSLQISTEVVGKIARCAALEVDGVAEVSCGVQNKKLKSLLESASIQPPVVVEMRDGTASITLHLMMQFGARIPSVAEKVQENVKSAVQNMTNVTVSRVDLVIAGLAEAQ